MPLDLNVNEQTFRIDDEPDTPLLWVLRDTLGLRGTRYGCGIAQCGACTVHVDGQPVRACAVPVGSLEGATVTTIEAVAGPEAEAVRAAWAAHDVPQCGFCQSGQIMSAVALLRTIPVPGDADIDLAMSGNLCRCATYTRIRAAIRNAARAGTGTA